jgi:RNA polymerase sigma factor (sigma-70 family)
MAVTYPKPRVCPDFRRLLAEADPDAAVIDQIARCYRTQLLGFARARCRDPALAEDTVQETMLSLMRALQSYRGDGPLEAWLNRLVVTSCSRLRRGKANEAGLHDDIETTPLADKADNQEATLLLSEQMSVLAAALSKVPEPNRTLLLRHEADDEPLDRLAVEFGLTVDGVKARLKRTRAELRTTLLAYTDPA